MDEKAPDAEKLISVSEPQSSAVGWPRYAAIALAVYVFVGGFVSFLGYPFDLPRLTDWNNEGISIQANTTVAVMATGLTVLLLQFGFRKLPIALSIIVAFIGATSIFQMATQIDLGFNTILTFGREWGRTGVVIPGLMGTPGATSWTLLGTSLLLVSLFTDADKPNDYIQARAVAVTLALIAMSISSLSLIGYLYGAEVLYTIPRLTIIALQTATFILCASVAVILLIRESGPMRLFADPGPAGLISRRIIPAIILLPLVIGAIRLAGERAGFYDTAFGSASRTLVEIVFLLTILWWTGTALGKQARQAKENELNLQQLANAMPQVVWIADESGKVHYYNDRVNSFGGITKLTTSLFDWQPGLHPEDLESTIKAWNAAVVNSQVYEHEHRILMADGTYRWHLSRAIPLVDDDGVTKRWYGTATDIHDRKSAEVTLRESEQRFSRFMQHLPGLSWIKDSYGKYIYANDAAQKAFQTEMPQLYGKSDEDLFPPATAAAFKDNDQRALDSVAGLQTVETLRGDDGILKFSLVSKFPIPAANGTRPMVGGMAIDITEQKVAEANREFLFKISETIRTARVAEDLLSDIADSLGRYLEIHRCLFNEIDIESDLETVHRDYARDGESVAGTHRISDYSPAASAQIRAGLTIVNRDSKTDPRTAEYFEKTYGPNKELSYIAVPMMRAGKWAASLWCSDDRPHDWTDLEISLVENIAERTWVAVERLRAESAYARLAAIVNSSDDAIISKDLNSIITSWNFGAEKIFGYREEEVLGKSITILMPPDRVDEEVEILSRIRNGESVNHYETIRQRKDGSLLDISLTVSPIFDANGTIIGASKVARDITERKRVEEAVIESETRYRTLFDSMDEGYCIIEVIFDEQDKPVDYLFIEVNRAFEHQAGMQDVVGRRMLEYVSDIEPHWLINYGKVAKTGQPVRFAGEYKGLNKSFEVYAFKIGDSESRRVAVLFTDITARKKAADALQESEARSKLAQETGGVGIWDWDASTELTYWSDTMWALYGEEVQEHMPDREFWDAHIYPDDRDRVRQHIEETLKSTRNVYRDEFRILPKNRDVRWVESIATVVRDEQGKPLRMYGVNLDLTEKKLVEQRIKASETQLRLVTNSIPALVSYIDKHERYQFVNRQYSEWFKKPEAEFIGKKMKDILGIGAYNLIKPYVDEALSGSEVSFDNWIHYKNAGEKFVHVSYVPDFGPDGSVLGFYALVSDLSDLRRSADLLRSSQERMRLLTESFTDYAIISTDPNGKVESWNPGAKTIFGYEEHEIIGMIADVLFTPDDVRKGVPLKEMREARINGRASDERWHIRKDGSRFFASGVMVPLYLGKTLTGYAKIASDLTERKRTAEALQRAHDEMEMRVLERTRELAETNAALVAEINERKAAEEQKIDLLKKLVTTQEDERRRIARDLHDQLGQRLTALRLKIASLREVVGEDEELKMRTTRLQEIAELLDSEVSFLAWELRPSAIEELGLVDAIGTFVREWSRHNGIEAEFHSTGMANFDLDPEADSHLYRIAQEALNNIVKHAEATKVSVLVERMDQEVVLIVEDNGKGFDRSQKNQRKTSKGLGLTGMGERASLIGAEVEIESAQGVGTTIFVRVPIRKSAKNQKV